MLAILIFAVLGAAILLPDVAAAWGPSAHLLIGRQAIEIFSANGAAGTASLIAAYPLDFLYGSVFADMSLGKKFFVFARLVHNWKVGFRLLDKAKTDANRACAYGYLAHLAADTVAHNEFVPRKLIEHYDRKGVGHISFEVMFDAMLRGAPGKDAREITIVGSSNNDEFLKSGLSRTLLSFKTSHRIFSGVLQMNQNDSVFAFRRWRARNSAVVKQSEVNDYLSKCLRDVMDLLRNERACACYASDPHGKDAIKQATRLRRKLREKTRRDKLTHREIREILAEFQHHRQKNR